MKSFKEFHITEESDADLVSRVLKREIISANKTGKKVIAKYVGDDQFFINTDTPDKKFEPSYFGATWREIQMAAHSCNIKVEKVFD